MVTVFDTIKDRLPITEVLASYITLIPSGSQLKAKCPFHTERSASFSVSPERGLYYCFGCGAKGDIFTFVERFEGVDKKGALKILADRAGVTLTAEHSKRESTDALFEALEEATNQYQKELKSNKEVLAYIKERGINEESISLFRIGYAPDQWRFVSDRMSNETEKSVALRAGLIKKSEKGHYDRFRKRIMFPINDSSSRVVGFSGRSYPADDKSAKYLNSNDSEIFQKSRFLFGFDKAKEAIRKHNFVVVVEGQVDCVLAHQAGFKNTVATSGTAISESSVNDGTSNLSAISRLTSNIFLAYDGDVAGQKAIRHAALIALSLGMNPKVVVLPQDSDPADYIKNNGAEAWKELLKNSKHFILYQTENIDKDNLSAYALSLEMKERLFPFLSKIQSPIERNSYLDSIAKELDISIKVLEEELSLYQSKNVIEKKEKPELISESRPTTIEERFLALLSRYPTSKNSDLKEKLKNLSFEEKIFLFSEVEEERMTELLSVVEKDYGILSEEEKEILAEELAKKIENKFYEDLRASYGRELILADKKEDQSAITDLLAKLQRLNQIHHGQT